jgi:hypothetical protein
MYLTVIDNIILTLSVIKHKKQPSQNSSGGKRNNEHQKGYNRKM